MSFSVHPTEDNGFEGIRRFSSEGEFDFRSAMPSVPPDRAIRWPVIGAVVLPLLARDQYSQPFNPGSHSVSTSNVSVGDRERYPRNSQ